MNDLARLILASTDQGMYGMALDGRITFVNGAACRMLGFSADELIGQEAHALIHHHRADGTVYPLEECPMRAACRLGERRRIDDEVLWRKDGVAIPVEYGTTPIIGNGDIVGAVVSFTDITRRKAAEEQLRETERFYRSVLELAPDGLMVVDATGAIRLANARCEALFGYSRDELIGRSVDLLVPPALRSRHAGLRDSYYRAPSVREMGANRELRAVRRDGTELPVEIGLSPLPAAGPEGARVAVSIRDVTERRARDAALARELAVAQELLNDARRRVEGPLLGDSPAIRALRESIARHGVDADFLLLTGPPGAGHEAVARAIHQASARSRSAFIHVNCALLPQGQDAGIFGPSPAASGGSSLSLTELAAQGTLYFEEIQRLPPAIQEHVAQVLERVEALRDAGAPADPDIHFIAGTSAQPDVSSGFHPKLLLLLERRQLRVPPLVERRDDIPDIARFFLSQHARRIGAVVEGISESSMKRLSQYRWPGNVSELQSVVERSVTASRGPVVEIDAALVDEGLPLGLYRLIEKIGEGGMGEVWRARHQLLARSCAIKVIKPDLLDGAHRESVTERFRMEARTIARLTSPNTVRLYDFGVTENGGFYFVMELLKGLDVMSLIERFGPLPAERAIDVLRQTCRSLAEAHGAGLLHRDIKPHNLYLCRLGVDYDVVKVLDFGLVKSLRPDAPQLTTAGVLTGTAAYMPPERVRGKAVDERSDLYALGCVAYAMLTGRPPFSGESSAILLDHVKTRPKPPSTIASQTIPDRLDAIVMACLEKTPANRPSSALELWRALGEIELNPSWTTERAQRWWLEHVPELTPQSSQGDSSDALPQSL
jgi:PAS domain S-box-containing protein